MMQRYQFAAVGPDGYHAGTRGEGRRSVVQQLYLRAMERGHAVTRAQWLAGHSAGCFLCSGGIFSERDGDAENWYNEHDCTKK